jgi:hypothetical protein
MTFSLRKTSEARQSFDSFPPNRASKMRENQQLFFGLRLVSRMFEENKQPAIQTKIKQPIGGFFQQIKV